MLNAQINSLLNDTQWPSIDVLIPVDSQTKHKPPVSD